MNEVSAALNRATEEASSVARLSGSALWDPLICIYYISYHVYIYTHMYIYIHIYIR